MNSDIWHKGYTPRREDISEVAHIQVLKEISEPVKELSLIDLGCGNKAIAPLFDNYHGIDLPMFDAYKDSMIFIKDYDVVLMNAFIDVMEEPIKILEKVFKKASNYIILHRQEFTDYSTTVDMRDAYGGWTWHSKINREEFVFLMKKYYISILNEKTCGFPNWNAGGSSLLMQKNGESNK